MVNLRLSVRTFMLFLQHVLEYRQIDNYFDLELTHDDHKDLFLSSTISSLLSFAFVSKLMQYMECIGNLIAEPATFFNVFLLVTFDKCIYWCVICLSAIVHQYTEVPFTVNPAPAMLKQDFIILIKVEATSVEAISFYIGIYVYAVLQKYFLWNIIVSANIMVEDADSLSCNPIDIASHTFGQ